VLPRMICRRGHGVDGVMDLTFLRADRHEDRVSTTRDACVAGPAAAVAVSVDKRSKWAAMGAYHLPYA